jgi:phosphomannomutase
MVKIKFGTDGWRAIIAREYTVDNVARVAEGTALWLKQNSESPKVVIGYDCRFGGKLFSETTAKVLCSHDITVILAHDFVSTPMVSLAALETGSDLGVVITASHNPPSYNGYKLKSKFGGPSSPQTIEEVENLIPETANVPEETIDSLVEKGLIT